jgi:hypothetical protein
MPLEPQRRRGVPNAAGTRASQSPASPTERTFLPMPGFKAALAMALGAFLFGCASPELPTPRHPIVPVPVIDLSARQTGDTVLLTFTMPTTSTDQQPLTDTPSVEIYRNAPAKGTATAPKRGAKNNGTARLANTIPSSAVEQYQRGARIEFPDKLDPSELSNESGTDLIYTVRTRVSRSKASADSNAAALRIYSPPATIRDLRVTMTETAPVLNWSASEQPSGATGAKAAGFRIYRAEVDPTAANAAVSDPSQAKLLAPMEPLAQSAGTEYRDTSFQFGHTYFYSVRAITQVGTETVESPDSIPVVLVAKDIFPPASPRDLEAVGVAATNGASASIELTWTINTEPDLAGYNVYRSENAAMPGQRLNNELLSVPTFRDMSVMPGKSYFYRVGAVDQSGNESTLSSIAEVQAPGP